MGRKHKNNNATNNLNKLKSIFVSNRKYRDLLTLATSNMATDTAVTLSDEELDKVAAAVIDVLSNFRYIGSSDEQVTSFLFNLDDAVTVSQQLCQILAPIVEDLEKRQVTCDVNILSTQLALVQCIEKLGVSHQKMSSSSSLGGDDNNSSSDNDDVLERVTSSLHKEYSTDMIGRVTSMFREDLSAIDLSALLQDTISEILSNMYTQDEMSSWSPEDMQVISVRMCGNIYGKFIANVANKLSPPTDNVRKFLADGFGVKPEAMEKFSDEDCEKLLRACFAIEQGNYSKDITKIRQIVNDDKLFADIMVVISEGHMDNPKPDKDYGMVIEPGKYDMVLGEFPHLLDVMSRKELFTWIDYVERDLCFTNEDFVKLRLKQATGPDRVSSILSKCDLSRITELMRLKGELDKPELVS